MKTPNVDRNLFILDESINEKWVKTGKGKNSKHKTKWRSAGDVPIRYSSNVFRHKIIGISMVNRKSIIGNLLNSFGTKTTKKIKYKKRSKILKNIGEMEKISSDICVGNRCIPRPTEGLIMSWDNTFIITAMHHQTRYSVLQVATREEFNKACTPSQRQRRRVRCNGSSVSECRIH